MLRAVSCMRLSSPSVLPGVTRSETQSGYSSGFSAGSDLAAASTGAVAVFAAPFAGALAAFAKPVCKERCSWLQLLAEHNTSACQARHTSAQNWRLVLQQSAKPHERGPVACGWTHWKALSRRSNRVDGIT